MAERHSQLLWIYKLSAEQLRKELSRRRQTTERSVTILHELVTCTLRIRRYELDDACGSSAGEDALMGLRPLAAILCD